MPGAATRRWGARAAAGPAHAAARPALQPLAPYALQRTPGQARRRKAAVVAAVILLGALYGFLLSFLPMAFYLYLAVPIVVMALLVIWALPQSDTFPEKAMERLFFALFLGMFLWPNYLAIALPGLPWITIVRLLALPMCLLMLVSLSISKTFRKRLWEPFTTGPWPARLMIGFVLLQLATLPLSGHIAESTNRFVNMQIAWTAVFFLSAFIFSKPGRPQLWVWMLCGVAFFLCLLAIPEARNQRVLWAGHIPSFLAVQDPIVLRILAGNNRFGVYRAQSTFSTSLSFAEFLGLAIPYFLYLALGKRHLAIRLFAFACIPLSFWVIRMTDSRVGVVAFFASLLLYFLLWSIKSWMRRKRDLIAPLLVLTYPIVATTFYILSLFWIRLHNMMWGGGETAASNEGRKAQYREGIPKILERPFGNGTGESGYFFNFTNPSGTVTIDTYYLVIGAEYGILGFFIYFGLIVTGIWLAVKYGLRSFSEEANLLLPAAVMLSVFIITKSVLAQEDTHSMIFLVLGMVVALAHKVNQEPRKAGAE
ncbi:MAG TPA: O-antigen ligase family protein [Allosphingosinicella sp.]